MQCTKLNIEKFVYLLSIISYENQNNYLRIKVCTDGISKRLNMKKIQKKSCNRIMNAMRNALTWMLSRHLAVAYAMILRVQRLVGW